MGWIKYDKMPKSRSVNPETGDRQVIPPRGTTRKSFVRSATGNRK